MHSHPRAFTLIELLVVVAIISLLSSLIIMGWPAVKNSTQRSVSLNNLRSIGVASQLYAADNDNRLPARITSTDKWPTLLSHYLDDIRVYAAVGDTNNYLFRKRDPLSNSENNTSYIMNGFNDIGSYTNETVEVRLNQIEKPSQIILFGVPRTPTTHFYMDFLGGSGGDHINVLNLDLYGGGSTYLFMDGSARIIKGSDYDNRLWLVNQDFAIP